MSVPHLFVQPRAATPLPLGPLSMFSRRPVSLSAWAAVAVLAGAACLPARAAQVGVSVEVSQPGVYGRIDIGRFPQPVLVSPQPVYAPAPVYGPAPVHAPPPVYAPAYPAATAQPMYLWVPPGHRRHWQAECYRYNACGVPVYFVEERWYRAHVMPERRFVDERHDGYDAGRDHGHGREHEHEHEHEHERERDSRDRGDARRHD